MQFGVYVEASDDREVTNNMKDRKRGYISLGGMGNLQGLLKCTDPSQD